METKLMIKAEMLLNCYMGMNMVNHQSNNYRYERKYFIASADKREIESMILIHPALFQEVYYLVLKE